MIELLEYAIFLRSLLLLIFLPAILFRDRCPELPLKRYHIVVEPFRVGPFKDRPRALFNKFAKERRLLLAARQLAGKHMLGQQPKRVDITGLLIINLLPKGVIHVTKPLDPAKRVHKGQQLQPDLMVDIKQHELGRDVVMAELEEVDAVD